MPFVQRVVQPVNLAQVCGSATGGGNRTTKFLCIPGKCKNSNCINNKQLTASSSNPQLREASLNGREQKSKQTQESSVKADDFLANSRTINNNNNVKDSSSLKSPSSTSSTSSSSTTTITTAIIHNTNGLDLNSTTTDNTDHSVTIAPHSNGFAASFSYSTDHEDDGGVITPVSPAPTMPMKKLKQHVEFLSTVPSPTRTHPSRPLTAGGGTAAIRSSSSHQRLRSPQTPQTPTSAKIVAGYEFDSISNITLSNALRQLASLVLIASDIFDDLQRELQTVGDRARVVQKKIVAVERRVSAYDPKTVTVPESDLLTFAQRKQHYDCDKSYIKELFTADTRPRSVRVLYEDAGKVTPPPSSSTAQSSAAGSPIQFASGHVLGDGSSNNDGMLDMTNAGGTNHHHHLAAGSDDLLLCSSAFGINTNRMMRTRIDAEIEIRLPAAIEDLRKWTSSEALGDVTVTPDCMHHVDTSISTSVCIGDNGILTPALSPSVLSADAVDALYSINVSNTIDNSQIPNDINKDVPLNHRLPSPEEQCKIIALRYPAEVISVDTSGKRFQRMCMARKSTTGVFTHMPDTNNLNEDVQTVSRRSRSRKARGKRRNTIAGIDQKEIQDAANGDSTATSGELKNALASTEDGNGDQRSRLGTTSKKFGRSKSSDILKKESVALPYDKGKNTLTRLNSLKQWGRNRFKFMQRNNNGELTQQHASTLSTIDSSGCSNDLNTSGTSSHNSSTEKAEICSASGSASGSSNKTSSTAKIGEKSGTDVDEDCRVHDLITQRTNESRFSHERKPSYSSSEKSMSVSSSGHLRGKLHLNSVCANVKLRDTSSLNRQRRINGLGSKDDQPHSSSGNWSASSESGRASIGSEITLQPKSSASNTSLNVSSFHNGSAPPSSMLSRRRFFNTSASSSVTSEGTATPDLQINANNMEGTYPNHLDDETSSAYSCDTEGYYTSFHMDSGLRTLKEEEFNMSNFQIGGQPFNASFGQSQLSYNNNSQQTLMAENEYELFGRGSTSTTTSSAGTVCTTLMAHNSGTEQSSLNNSLASCGPEVPERISSLRHSTASTSTLERSISSSTIGSTLERTGTIKRNVNASLKLTTCSDEQSDNMQNIDTPESQEEEFNYSEQIKKRQALPLPSASNEIEYSESSDLEGVERIERMRQKTALNAKRIPSMCIITPSTSDDENQAHEEQDNGLDDEEDELNKTLTEDSFKDLTDIEEDEKLSLQEVDNNLNHVKANMSLMDKLKVVLPNIKKSPSKALPSQELTVINDDELYDMAGEYVYISADVSNNNKKALQSAQNMPKASANTGLGIYYSNNVLNRLPKPTEYVSLNELPRNIQKAYAKESQSMSSKSEKGSFNRETQLQEQRNKQGAESQFVEETKQSNLPTMANTTTTMTRAAAASIPMYAEINELRSEIAASASTNALSYLQNTPPSSAASSPHVSPHKGARVRLNAQGKPIYDSDSLKRRKGAHTTFAPGPYVKRQQEDALDNNDYKEVENESIDTTIRNTTSESVNPAAKLLLLNKGNANPRKIANVRPIINKSHLQRPLPSTPVELQQQQYTANEMSGFYMTSQYAVYNKDTGGSNANANNTKHLIANGTNPYFHQQSMHSPSTKSTASSTGSTISSTASSSLSSSTTTTTQSGSSKDDEGKLYKPLSIITSSDPSSSITLHLDHTKKTKAKKEKLNNIEKSLETTSASKTPTPTLSTFPPPPPLPPRDLKYQNFKHKQTAANNALPPQLVVNPSDDDIDDVVVVNESPFATAITTTSTPNNKEKSIQYNDDPKTNLKKATTNDKILNSPNNAKTHLPTTTTLMAPQPSAHSPSLSANKHMPLKRNNSYRLANDDLKLEMNKENHNVYNDSPTPSIATPSPHHFQSLPRTKVKNILHNVLDDSSQKSHLSPQPNLTSTPQNTAATSTSGNQQPVTRKIAKSFERLVDEFSLSTISMDSSYLRNKSLENFDDSPSILTPNLTENSNTTMNGKKLDEDDVDSDSDLDSLIAPSIPQIKYHKSFIEAVLIKPLKIIRPTDENRKRILQKFEVTEIW
ncbi:Nance-Horan syndrome protein [Lucilia cuprina]|nr:Nance-Horan syndrome protein [Lucilia cuprina]